MSRNPSELQREAEAAGPGPITEDLLRRVREAEAEVERLRTILEDLAVAADTAELTVRELNPGEAQSLNRLVKKAKAMLEGEYMRKVREGECERLRKEALGE